jgi:putative exosortase-associated protein (TIGR04073 family)
MPYRHLATFLLAMLMFASAPAGAEVYKDVESSTPQEIVDAMAAKGVRGAANAVTGWLELPKQIYVTSQEDGWARGVVIGPVKGIGMALVRTVAGVGELATFFVPYPGFFNPWFEPRYVWQKE